MQNRKTLSADYIVVGAGSAGCVLASRLSEDRHTSVLLLEAGGSRHPWFIRMPAAFYMPIGHKKYDWRYRSEPEPNLHNRQMACPRGKGLGGSSAINGMVYVRGNRADFQRWPANWQYADVLPYFKKAQNAAQLQDQAGEHPAHTFMGARFMGKGGPLATRNGDLHNPLYHMFLDAAEQAGYARQDDLNGEQQEGFGPLAMTVSNGQRASAARAYLGQRRHNLQIMPHFHTHRVLFESNRAVGVVGSHQRRRTATTLRANREVIICSGAIASPQLLMLSGIGPAQHLRQMGLDPAVDLSGVGQNLMDHLEVYVQQACTQPLSLYKNLTWAGRTKIGLQWLTTRRGLGTSNHFEVGGFMRSNQQQDYPDIQFHFLPAAMSYDGSAKAECHGFQAHVGPMLSPSRGQVILNSKNPGQHPRIQFNYMAHAEDWVTFRAAIRAAREIFSQAAFAPVRGMELSPGEAAQSDAELDEFIRRHAQSAYHPCGTCRMGDDKNAVVDSYGRVHGIEQLRVVDASIFPHITNGNLNAPTIMVAERMADLIRNPAAENPATESSA